MIFSGVGSKPWRERPRIVNAVLGVERLVFELDAVDEVVEEEEERRTAR